MEELIEILEDIQPGVDYHTCTTLIDDHILDSFGILSEVSPAELVPDNFNSAERLMAMINRLKGEQ